MKSLKLFFVLLATTASLHISAQLSLVETSILNESQLTNMSESSSTSESIYSTETIQDIKQQLEFKINYPASMIPFDIEGESTIKLTINKDGSIDKYEILESLGAAFDAEIKNTLERVNYISPVRFDGLATKQAIVFPIQFRL